MSHLGSGSADLLETLTQNPRVDAFRTGLCYDHPDKLAVLTNNIHKQDNKSAIYMDELLYNISFACKPLCKHCKFIHLVREAKPSLNFILERHPEYTIEAATRYYCFRLRGIYEYVLRTPGSVFLTWDELQSGNKLKEIESYLGLKEPLKYKEPKSFDKDLAPQKYVAECQEAYEKYVYAIKHLV